MEDIPKRILVVDDEKSIRLCFREFLKDAGYDVSLAENAQEALKKLSERDYDVLVSDIVLPGISGLSLLKTVREALPNIPTIMMTGEPTTLIATEAYNAGASDFLEKPVKKNTILDAIARALTSADTLDN